MRNSPNRLRSLAARVDDRHREAMRLVRERVQLARAADLRSRRRFLTGVGVGTASLALAPPTISALRFLPAGAQEDGLTDEDLATFLASVELVAVEVYRGAVEAGVLSGALLADAGRFEEHHQEYADSYSDAAGSTPEANSGLMADYETLLSEAVDETSMLNVLLTLEDTLAATHVAIQAEAGAELAAVIATIAPVEGQHAVVLGHALELEPPEYLPALQTVSGSIDPAAYPPE